MSRLTILAIGSRGDFEPYLALATALMARGHRVRIAGAPLFQPSAAALGLDFAPIRWNPRDSFQSPEGLRLMKSQRRLLRGFRDMRGVLEPHLHDLFDDCLAAATDSDAILYSILAFPAVSVAERYGIPALAAFLQPATTTRAHPNLMFPQHWRLGGYANLASYWLADLLFARVFGPMIATERQRLGFPRDQTAQRPRAHLYGFSPTLFAKPNDWGPQHHVTGFWVRDGAAIESLPGPLSAFLDAPGPPIVAIGFGSMVDPSPSTLCPLIVEAVRQARVRAIILGGWSKLDGYPWPSEHFYALSETAHAPLFAKVSAVVHHGGAGTTAACMRAGKPQLVIPYFADQFFWGERTFQARLGVKQIPRRRLTADRLSHALKQLLALDLGPVRHAAEAIERENGQAVAADLVSSYAGPGT